MICFRKLLLLLALAPFSGCAMCDCALDSLYPASGGCGGYHADCGCRAGSGFCPGAAGPRVELTPDEPGTVDMVPPPPAEPGDSRLRPNQDENGGANTAPPSTDLSPPTEETSPPDTPSDDTPAAPVPEDDLLPSGDLPEFSPLPSDS